MSKRLQVLLSQSEFDAVRALAADEGLTVSEWVRQLMRRASRQRAGGDIEDRLSAVRTATRYSFPTADIDDMLREVEQGYLVR